ncbi:PucR family transcriptional regulator ligand-binding domain-containing protein [uncultured Bifidobacterium sp.]|uniref:PucR family transcriptional regulator n=1 Tax=uncultured Bifidobacterium sp. TaxID=165187 RepID=UPI0028DC9C00|nr:PucR family transcriptional regulator ligand-binding domain-containing protein [uncultured Bifidobacterium sp.]
MSVSIRDVLQGPVFRRCDPCVAAGREGIGKEVRWAYTNERYDVTRFLGGGELLIIEGSALSEHASPGELETYVDSLAEANVSGIAIELLDHFTAVPEAMVARADELGLPVIGLRRRQPFVALCQEINSRITREQLLAHMEVDNLSSALNARFSRSQSVQDVADALADVIGEHVLILGTDGVLMATAGTREDPGQADGRDPVAGGNGGFARDLVLPVSYDEFLVANVVVSQSIAVVNADSRRCVESSLARALPPFVSVPVAAKMRMRLLAGSRDGVLASDEEAADAESLLRALGPLAGAHCLPFIVGIRSWRNDGATASDALDVLRGASPRNVSLLAELEGTEIVGAFLTDDPELFAGLADVARRRLRALPRTSDLRIVEGMPAVGARGLLDSLAAVRYVDRIEPAAWGRIVSSGGYAFRRMASVANSTTAMRMFVAQTAGSLQRADDVALDTLCALGESLGDKTEACGRLGVSRQALYARLDRIAQMTGVPRHDPSSWSLMTVAARMVRETRERRDEAL